MFVFCFLSRFTLNSQPLSPQNKIIDVLLAKQKVRSNELAASVGITESNLSLLKSGKVKGVRFGTLAAICRYLECKPGDILDYELSDEDSSA
tara:strand:+ start:330 stop:605 length:276 start_codon:yes stop_codon:yes gene_type:complete